ncbi:MAG: 1,2-phenylacetyl-CoA epoxidase subunit PaaC [Planctomycetota bacterium]|nr:1,2-phenylacetyl-CoA epoxidase subunit PaaC [Planctomycetota bacterium]
MSTFNEATEQAAINLCLSIADDKLFLGHRNSNWTGIAPILEADIAFSSLAQDDIAHASAIYELAGALMGDSADEVAYGRKPDAYLCADIVTKDDGFDWANAIARQFYCNHFNLLRFERLSNSSWSELAALCKRLIVEQQIQVNHINDWILQLAKGTPESKGKIVEALNDYACEASMMFETPYGFDLLIEEGIVNTADDIFSEWHKRVRKQFELAGVEINVKQRNADAEGGRSGVHSEDFNESLRELQAVYREDPTAAW